jgi:hypothetical protein
LNHGRRILAERGTRGAIENQFHCQNAQALA